MHHGAMYLVVSQAAKADCGMTRNGVTQHMEEPMEQVQETAVVAGFAGWIGQAGRWWRDRDSRQRSRAGKRQMFIVETLSVGPKQRVVLLRCGGDQFLVGTGPEGIQSITRVGEIPVTGELPVVTAGVAGWS